MQERTRHDLDADATAALEQARNMPPGLQRTQAMKRAGILRSAADIRGIMFAKRAGRQVGAVLPAGRAGGRRRTGRDTDTMTRCIVLPPSDRKDRQCPHQPSALRQCGDRCRRPGWALSHPAAPCGRSWPGVSGRSLLTFFDPRREMNEASRCRIQAEECHRLMLLAQSGAEATILTSLMRSWKMIANQTDRYVAIMKREAAQKGRPIR